MTTKEPKSVAIYTGFGTQPAKVLKQLRADAWAAANGDDDDDE